MTLFTIRETDRPGNRYAVATIDLHDGAIGGAGFFRTAEQAREVITSAYKTPLCPVDEETFRAARQVCRETMRRELAVAHV